MVVGVKFWIGLFLDSSGFDGFELNFRHFWIYFYLFQSKLCLLTRGFCLFIFTDLACMNYKTTKNYKVSHTYKFTRKSLKHPEI
jgi:hypothetical protein